MDRISEVETKIIQLENRIVYLESKISLLAKEKQKEITFECITDQEK